MPYAPELKEAAKRLYLRRCKPREIQAQLSLPNIRIIYYWIRQGEWDDMLSDEEPLTAVGRRITLLLDKATSLTKSDLDELDRLTTVRERLLKQSIKPLSAPVGEPPADDGQRREGQRSERRERGDRSDKGGKKREKKAKNEVGELTEVDFLDKFISKMYGYQKELFAAKQNPLTSRIRNILKSRQVGLTYYFAGEAFMDAVLTGDNQIFLSASRAQSEIFRSYIVSFAQEWFGLELTGNPIVLSKDGKPWAELRFLSTNSSTAQGHHGHVYVDEYFWIRDFEKLNTVASAMATHKKWRKTYFSTPSAMSHEAYPFWSGERHAKLRGKSNALKMDVSHKALREGKLCSDKIWRQIVTIYDAEAGGCDLFDIDELKNFEYTEEEFNNLLLCQFIDDTKSVFPLQLLQRCMMDSWEEWTDYKPHAARPFGNKAVWIGYDPSDTGDKQGCVVIAPPSVPGGKFRVLERIQFQNPDYQVQANEIKKLTEKYNVEYIGIDVTGMGRAVFQLVQLFFPAATPISYSVEVKTEMVLKMQNVMRNGRLEFDAGFIDLAQSFMSIRKVITPSGRQATYASGRTQAVGHADLAWATMNAIAHEPLQGTTEAGQNIMEMS